MARRRPNFTRKKKVTRAKTDVVADDSRIVKEKTKRVTPVSRFVAPITRAIAGPASLATFTPDSNFPPSASLSDLSTVDTHSVCRVCVERMENPHVSCVHAVGQKLCDCCQSQDCHSVSHLSSKLG